MAELPNRIRELRNGKEWSLDRLAAMVGCSKVQLADLELGKRRLSTHWMERIAPALGVAVPDLLSFDQNPFRLSSAEMRLVEMYRAADPSERRMLERLTDTTLGPVAADDEAAA